MIQNSKTHGRERKDQNLLTVGSDSLQVWIGLDVPFPFRDHQGDCPKLIVYFLAGSMQFLELALSKWAGDFQILTRALLTRMGSAATFWTQILWFRVP